MQSDTGKSSWIRASTVILLAFAMISILAPSVAAANGDGAADFGLWIFLAVIIALVVIFILYKSVIIIQPWEQGLKIVLGKYKQRLGPGVNIVPPLVTRPVDYQLGLRIDLRTQVFDVPQQEVITKDNSPTRVDAIIYIKVVDPEKAYFQVANYKLATVALAQTTLRSTVGDMELDEILYNRSVINTQLRDTLDEATDPWGVKVEMVEIREVDPLGPVKAAMMEQTAAERERRAAILTADGEKRSFILKAEGEKRSRILKAEGVKQATIVEAQGNRLKQILEAQGEAQALRVLAVGASTLDQKALTIKSLNTLALMADGKATKIIFPFEITKLMEGAAEFMGASRTVPDRPISALGDLEQAIGPVDVVLGEIPSPESIALQLDDINKQIALESKESLAMAQSVMTDDVDTSAGDRLPLRRTLEE